GPACSGCGAARNEVERCAADPGPPQIGAIPGLQRTTSCCAAPGTRWWVSAYALDLTSSGATSEEATAMDTKAFPVTRTDEEWRRLLTPEQYRVMRRHGTERPGSCALNYEKRPGSFVCAGCGQPLFVSKTKFESGTGWPSFNDPVPGAVETTSDRSY